MKTNHWTIDETTGAISKVGPFSRGLNPVEIEARTKGEATAKALARHARTVRAGGPRLLICNGAYLMLSSDGDGWAAETGTLHPRRAMASDGTQFPLCSGGAPTLREAIAKSSLNYYGSEEFQTHERRHYGPLGTVEADMLATLRELTAAVGAIGASEAARLGLVMPHANALALLGKLTGSPVPAGQSATVATV